jgi:hypothetical protein
VQGNPPIDVESAPTEVPGGGLVSFEEFERAAARGDRRAVALLPIRVYPVVEFDTGQGGTVRTAVVSRRVPGLFRDGLGETMTGRAVWRGALRPGLAGGAWCVYGGGAGSSEEPLPPSPAPFCRTDETN